MNCIVVDSLYARFQTWKIKCENILETELASLPDARKCQILLRWLDDQGLEIYQVWCLQSSEVSKDILWYKFEDLCKPQANELRTRNALSRHSAKQVHVLMNGITPF